jgi:hypothetical protein
LFDEADFAPCKLSEYQGKFSVLFTGFDERFYQQVRAHNGQGGGHSLQAMVQAALEIDGVKLADIRFDSEADMFVARGEKSSLKTIAGIVRQLLGDPTFAEQAIAHSVSRGEFD